MININYGIQKNISIQTTIVSTNPPLTTYYKEFINDWPSGYHIKNNKCI